MDLHESVAVVTCSNRSLGHEFAAQLIERGAEKVYARRGTRARCRVRRRAIV
jgi:NAD(P)-dependent dehydrogenase (short-subunit alcohol dehydrogenase family)